MADLLLEIGCEEIPAKMLARAVAELPDAVTKRLADARLSHGAVQALGTPRRLAVIVRDVADRQPDLRERVVGPPASAAFDKEGNPTKAAIGFAQKNGVDPSALETAEVEGPKKKMGQYVVAQRFAAGRGAMEVLPSILSELIAALPWPKSMRWGWSEHAFVRPVHWLVALWGGEVLPVAWGGLTAGRRTRGHRFLAPGWIDLASPAEYASQLRRAHVVVDVAARKDLVRAELARIEQETGGRVRKDDTLLDEVTNLCEWPVGVVGSFDPAYLEVPEEIIVTALRTHQRYFTLEDRGGKLMPKFVTMANTVTRDPKVVAHGNERASAPRLADARFFVTEDRKKRLDQFAALVAPRIFLAKFGPNAATYGHKIKRIEGIVAALAERVAFDREIALVGAAQCKSDLATSVVGEFPELQGIMGMHYARGQYAPGVDRVIAEHYMPRGAGAELPASAEGAVVAIADRIDTLVGCFASSLEPTGSADPYGLRRAAIGILSILLARDWDLSIDTLIEIASQQYAGACEVTDTDCGELAEFFRGRLRGVLIEHGLAPGDIDAALGAGFALPRDASARARDLAVMPSTAREVFKRIANIVDDAHSKGERFATPDPALFKSPVEHALWNEYSARHDRIANAFQTLQYRDLFAALVELQPHVAAYFDKGGVMVMDPDPDIRANRLGMLELIKDEFAKVADFRAVSASGGES
ncbi:MAG TPA: glycine--tRNA ligase subunit beta [Kofleriaceae bacterium]|jgi:glycyl-tRNA synthetase beta chain|nr:glycine--tRNA ligase subunit beta [Kofleriaceae bacterium]